MSGLAVSVVGWQCWSGEAMVVVEMWVGWLAGWLGRCRMCADRAFMVHRPISASACGQNLNSRPTLKRTEFMERDE